MPQFDFVNQTATDVTIQTLLNWIAQLHTELTNCGLLPGTEEGISDQTHNEIMVLAIMAEK